MVGAEPVEGGDDTDDRGMREEEKSEAFGFRSLLEQRQRNLADVEAVEVVVGTCVYIICPRQDTMHEAAFGAPPSDQFRGSR
jgi:hypothetical protein